MIVKALYVGKKAVNRKERIGANGQTIPAFKGTHYTFLVNDWDNKGNLTEETFGKTYIDARHEDEEIESIEKGAVKLGDTVNVSIRKADFNVNYFCTFEEEPF